jgi:uncharacterized membrane protein YqjE
LRPGTLFMSPPPFGGGLYASLRRLFDTTLETAQVRIALLGSELEREKLRLIDGALLAAVGLLMLGVSLVLLVALLVLLFQEGYRIAALAVALVAFLAGGLLLLLRARAVFAADGGQPFALTLGELRRDREAFAARMDPEAGGADAATAPPRR